MTAPNRNTLWARSIVHELVASGIDAVCVCPGSRSTPLTVAFAEHDDIHVFSHLDERSAAYFALGRGKRTGQPTPVVSTSGTATANFHPAVMEANEARVPLLVLTADRPPELRDSGANQTTDQEKLYGDDVRYFEDLPEPEVTDRKLRSLRTSVCRAVATTGGANPGPVHLNVPFRKPLEPVAVPDDIPNSFVEEFPLGAFGRTDDNENDTGNDDSQPRPFVSVTTSPPRPDDEALETIVDAVIATERGLLIAGPDDAFGLDANAGAKLSRATGFPILGDPLSGIRFGTHVPDTPVVGGYDGFLPEQSTGDGLSVDDSDSKRASLDSLSPDLVIRFGASPTSKTLQNFLRDSTARQFVIDPAGEWREATFTASDLIVSDPTHFARDLATKISSRESTAVNDDTEQSTWADRWTDAESEYWDTIDDIERETLLEGDVLATVTADALDPATVFVSNSMPVRDLDRFARPGETDLTVLGNRGASGIDGITSTALGAGSATDNPLVLVTGDLAYYHDLNGLLALERCEVDATIVLVNNDGGGIFHMLPIEDFDPPFTDQFKTPHGLDFSATSDLFDLEFERFETLSAFREAYLESVESTGTQVLEIRTDSETSHRERERINDCI